MKVVERLSNLKLPRRIARRPILTYPLASVKRNTTEYRETIYKTVFFSCYITSKLVRFFFYRYGFIFFNVICVSISPNWRSFQKLDLLSYYTFVFFLYILFLRYYRVLVGIQRYQEIYYYHCEIVIDFLRAWLTNQL